MFDVKVRKIFAFVLFIFRTTFSASASSIDWYPRFANELTICSTVMFGFHIKSFTFFILKWRVVTRII